MLTRQKLRNLLRKKIKAEESLIKASNRIKLRNGQSTTVDNNIIERNSLILNKIEEEINKIESDYTMET